jgi:hypothetical protein
MLRADSLALLLPLAACAAHGQDAHLPGDPLGTFHVTASLQSDTCKAAFLGVSDPWQFDVELSRKTNVLYWLNGAEAIPGDITGDGTAFSFQSGVEMAVVPPSSGRPGCTVARADAASGTLSSASTDVTSFESELSFEYRDAPSSDCSPWVGTGDGFAELPCTVQYSASAARTKAPASK